MADFDFLRDVVLEKQDVLLRVSLLKQGRLFAVRQSYLEPAFSKDDEIFQHGQKADAKFWEIWNGLERKGWTPIEGTRLSYNKREIVFVSRGIEDPEVVVCIDNQGLEDSFDLNVEYLLLETRGEYILVENKLGEEVECNTSRFKQPLISEA